MARIGQHRGHLLGMRDVQRQQVQPPGADGLGREGAHAAITGARLRAVITTLPETTVVGLPRGAGERLVRFVAEPTSLR
ncbi:hypothetical protein ACIPSA_12085 [Streptomyces sp. NPDC086549]|uniref:hypothetical protein n=1 Tax=Streptomyces sp. NPDC086549 TaxID=3365752 RepID=UPI00381B851F